MKIKTSAYTVDLKTTNNSYVIHCAFCSVIMSVPKTIFCPTCTKSNLFRAYFASSKWLIFNYTDMRTISKSVLEKAGEKFHFVHANRIYGFG